MYESIIGFIGVLVGALVTFLSERHFRNADDKAIRAQNSAVLLNDLESIREYFEKLRALDNAVRRSEINIRYYTEWQNTLSKCTQLTREEIKFVYKIYDLVYDYNYAYSVKSNTDVNATKSQLNDVIFSDVKEFDYLIDKLKIIDK